MKTVNEIIAQFDVSKVRIGEIYEKINGQQNAEASLIDLNSVSTTSRFNLWKYVTAFVLYIQQQLWAEAKLELKEIRDTGVAANKAWFSKEWKGFQYGDALLINDTTGKYYYAVPDVVKQIISKLAIVQNSNAWLVKVAKDDGAGNNVPLAALELTAFKEFIDLTQPAGPRTAVLSLDGDEIDVRFNVYYNPLRDVVSVRALAEAAYLAYLEEIDIEGDSVYYINRHIDKIKAINITENANIIDDVELISCEAAPDGDVYTSVIRIYQPLSGYLVKEPTLVLTDAIILIPKL